MKQVVKVPQISMTINFIHANVLEGKLIVKQKQACTEFYQWIAK